jgi:hypothetical protein
LYSQTPTKIQQDTALEEFSFTKFSVYFDIDRTKKALKRQKLPTHKQTFFGGRKIEVLRKSSYKICVKGK